MCSNPPTTCPHCLVDPSDLTGTLIRQTAAVEARRDALVPQISSHLIVAYTAPDRSVAQQAAYMEALPLVGQLLTAIRDFVDTLAVDMIPVMEGLGYDFEASERLFGWGRERWRAHLGSLRSVFHDQKEFFRGLESFVKSELERIEEGVERRFVVRWDDEGRLIGVWDVSRLRGVTGGGSRRLMD